MDIRLISLAHGGKSSLSVAPPLDSPPHRGLTSPFMKSLSAIFIALSLCVLPAVADLQEAGWMTDFKKASELSTEKKLPMLVAFVNSQQGGWYQKLQDDILSTDIFKTFAAESLVLVLADYPEDKQQAEDILEQNKELIGQYKIKRFPTIVLISTTGKEIGRSGYRKGGPQAFVNHLKSLLDASAEK